MHESNWPERAGQWNKALRSAIKFPVSRPPNPLHLDAAMGRFRDFFNELKSVFIERDEVLTQSALALLAREHQLITGPPGTAKSQLAALVLGRIVDEQTGKPSLFSRQFTESTVQTDLIGAIDFKTLMETGRTEHFTDEGLLGSVHAFLDEVFDGRDMLLRSTLNLLNEREFKQGNITAKGQIECAFMTSNRYISEILETSRQSLLAFVDRLNFISFVPRNFSDPSILKDMVRRHGGGFGIHRPNAVLSIQDLDALQAAVDLTYVSEDLCDAIADLITDIDREMLEARRHDPKFQPTRFFSARTAVQATGVLRAAVVYDKIFHNPKRALQVEFSDLKQLRYHLLLSGVPLENIGTRIEREQDPRERRQLNIIRTEAEIFERCVAKVPVQEGRPVQQKTLAFDSLRTMVQSARSSSDPQALGNAVRKLVSAMESGASNADKAADLLFETVGAMSERALRVGLVPTFGMQTKLAELASGANDVARELENASASYRPMSNWVCGRLLQVIDDSLRLGSVASAESIELLVSDSSDSDLNLRLAARMKEFEGVKMLRTELQSSGVSSADPTATAEAWSVAQANLEDELVLLWGARFRNTAMSILQQTTPRPLQEVLDSLTPFLEEIDAAEKRCTDLGRTSELKRRVVGPRLEPVVERAVSLLRLDDRGAMVAEVQQIVERLSRPEIADIVSSKHLVRWIAPLLIRQEQDATGQEINIADRDSYQLALEREHSHSIIATLIEIAILGIERQVDSSAAPEELSQAVSNVLCALSAQLQSQIVDGDLARIQRRLGYLQSWWQNLTPSGELDAQQVVDVLETVAQSGLLRVLRGDGEALVLSTEARRVVEVFPEAQEKVESLRDEIEAFDRETRTYLVALLEGQANQAWQSALGNQ